MNGTILGILVAAAMAVALTFAVRSRARSRGRAMAQPSRAEAGAIVVSSPGESAALERSKLVIHGLLHGLSDSIDTFVQDNARYDNSLEVHKTAITRAMTLAGIQELERVLVRELENIRDTNAEYRAQLDKANDTVKQQQVQLERLQSDVERDFLTELPNRRAFDSRMAEFFDRFKRYENTFSLVVLDIDHFKQINDQHGHVAGDRILRGVGKILDDQKRSTDFLARYGGEEFVLVLPETKLDQARTLAEKTREKIERAKFRYEDRSIDLTLSAGVGEIRPDDESKDAFFARVDAALYDAKNGGRNRVEVVE